jgi:hypothetical protein
MDKPSKKLFRCAIYTRKSTEHNLDLEFNSLDAQREACEAYRPALQELLTEVKGGKIDIIVACRFRQAGRTIRPACSLESWLAKSRMRGDGPLFLKVGHSIRYSQGVLVEWTNSQLRSSTSERT